MFFDSTPVFRPARLHLAHDKLVRHHKRGCTKSVARTRFFERGEVHVVVGNDREFFALHVEVRAEHVLDRNLPTTQQKFSLSRGNNCIVSRHGLKQGENKIQTYPSIFAQTITSKVRHVSFIDDTVVFKPYIKTGLLDRLRVDVAIANLVARNNAVSHHDWKVGTTYSKAN